MNVLITLSAVTAIQPCVGCTTKDRTWKQVYKGPELTTWRTNGGKFLLRPSGHGPPSSSEISQSSRGFSRCSSSQSSIDRLRRNSYNNRNYSNEESEIICLDDPDFKRRIEHLRRAGKEQSKTSYSEGTPQHEPDESTPQHEDTSQLNQASEEGNHSARAQAVPERRHREQIGYHEGWYRLFVRIIVPGGVVLGIFGFFLLQNHILFTCMKEHHIGDARFILPTITMFGFTLLGLLYDLGLAGTDLNCPKTDESGANDWKEGFNWCCSAIGYISFTGMAITASGSVTQACKEGDHSIDPTMIHTCLVFFGIAVLVLLLKYVVKLSFCRR